MPFASSCTFCRSAPTHLASRPPGTKALAHIWIPTFAETLTKDLCRVEDNFSPDMSKPVDVWERPPALAPIKSLHELLNWNPKEQPFHNLFRANVPLLQVTSKSHQRHKAGHKCFMQLALVSASGGVDTKTHKQVTEPMIFLPEAMPCLVVASHLVLTLCMTVIACALNPTCTACRF